VWVVVPIKPFALAKRRLSVVLTETERARLARAMLTDLLTTLSHCERVTRVVCVTREKAVPAIAERFGAMVLPEAEPGLSKSVFQAARHLQAQGATSLLMLPTDVPLATSVEIDQLIARHGWAPAVTLVSDEEGYGTNAIAVSPPDLMPFRFGRRSFEAHRAAANALGARVQTLRSPGLALDIDRPDDLRRVLSYERALGTLELLTEIDVLSRLAPQPVVSAAGQWNL